MAAKQIKLNTIVAATVVIVCIETLARWAGSAVPEISLGFTAVPRLMAIVALLMLVGKMESSLDSIGLDRLKLGHGLARGAIWSMGFAVGAAVLFAGCHLAGTNPFSLFKVPLPEALRDVILYFLVGAGLAPIAEEIYFRGLLFGYFRRWGPLAAVMGSTMLFVAAHPNLQQLPIAQIVGGLVFAIAYELEENLVVPIVIHAAGNLALFSLSLIG